MNVLWHNGTFRDEAMPVFTAADRIRLGDGVFDTMLALDGRLIRAQEHMERLQDHARIFGIQIPYSTEQMIAAAESLIAKNEFKTGAHAVNSVVSHGPGERGLAAPETAQPQVLIRAAPVPQDYPPLSVVIATGVRRNEGSPLSRIKSFNYGDNILALQEARRRGALDAIMLNNRGLVTCATAGSVFAQHGHQLFTPPLSDGALESITRRIIIEFYGALEKNLEPGDLREADGLYITNSIAGARAVSALDGHALPVPSLTIDKTFHLS
jgi:branched-chain amino acid aminotransferase